MGRGFAFATFFFIFLVPFWLSSMHYVTEARPLNEFGLPSNNRHTQDVFEEIPKRVTESKISSGLSSHGGGHRYKYSRNTEATTGGPSPPGEGHKNSPPN
ncbi:hypothetical protein ACB092_07G116900 [Castanea dentata]